MNFPWTTAARWFGGTTGVIIGIAALFTIGGVAKGGIRCSQDTTWVAGPVITVPVHQGQNGSEQVHGGIPIIYRSKLDSLTHVIREKDSLLAQMIDTLRAPRKFQWDWSVVKDSMVVYGMAVLDWCPENGLASHRVVVDSISTPTHILKITETIMIATGIDWYWIPVAVIVAFLIGWAV